MTPQGKKRLIIGTSLVVILGVVGYFVWKKFGKKGEETPPPPPDTSGGGSGGGSSTTSTGGGGGGGTIQSSNPFSSSDELKKFQEWVINTKKDTAILGKWGADGKWGTSSANAWAKYGAEYGKGTTTQTTTSTTPTDVNSILDEVQRNLGQGAIPVERYTGKVIAKITDANGKVFAGSFQPYISSVTKKPVLYYQVYGPGVVKSGYFANGGKTITMGSGRVLSSGSVWTNIRNSVTA